MKAPLFYPFFPFACVAALAYYVPSFAAPPTPQQLASITNWIEANASSLVQHYQHLHAHPEVSYSEKETATYVSKLWREAGYNVTEEVGGHGVVAVLSNGTGPTLLIRTDLDALPVTEATGLPFASKAETKTEEGATTGVMHACGHDLHMTVVTGAAGYLAAHRQHWNGTLVVIGQPAEERVGGASAMLKDGLYTRFPKPDFALALHVESATPAGTVAIRSGYMLANVDGVDIEVIGRGGHGASPETTIDPVVQTAELILSLQTIVSREVKPTEPAVITVGSIHGGTKHNIIGDRCKLQLTVRSYSPEVRQLLLESIRRRAKGIAATYGAPEPKISVTEGTSALANDPELAARLSKTFSAVLGQDRVRVAEQVMGAEDFSQYATDGVKILMYRLGVIQPRRLEHFRMLNQPPPSLHSAQFYPDLDDSLETGILTMVSSAIDLLSP